MWLTVARKKKSQLIIENKFTAGRKTFAIVKKSQLWDVTLWSTVTITKNVIKSPCEIKNSNYNKKKLHLEQNKAALKVNKSNILGSKMSTLVNNTEK